ATSAELLVPDQGVASGESRRAGRILGPAQPLERRVQVGPVVLGNLKASEPLVPKLTEHRTRLRAGGRQVHVASLVPMRNWSRIHRVSRCPASCSALNTQRAPEQERT